MCGRYYVDDETVKEIKRLVWRINQSHRHEPDTALDKVNAGDVCPGSVALVLSEKSGMIRYDWRHWGFPKQWENDLLPGKGLVINARCETAMDKPLFRNSILHNRVVVLASGFYEWNAQKEKNTFWRKDASLLFMAGCSRRYEDGMHFVILTTAANASMEQVHDRMPLILEPEEVTSWLMDDTAAENILKKTPCLLERKTDYEQISLF